MGGTADLELIAYPGQTFKGRVTRIADTVNSETRTIKVTAELANPGGRLRPEMYGRLRYADGTVPAPWIPDAAVIRSSNKEFVFVSSLADDSVPRPLNWARSRGWICRH